MGLRSWRKEFYPISAHAAANAIDTRKIIAHSLQKWTGVLPKNLKKHNVKLEGGFTVVNKSNRGSTEPVYLDSSSCSLCRKYYGVSYLTGTSACSACPLYKARGNVSCTNRKASEEYDPYTLGTWYGDGKSDPRLMIRWLKKTLAIANKKEANKKQAAKKRAKKGVR